MSSSATATHRKRAVHYIMEFLREEQLWDTLEAMEKECVAEIEDDQTQFVSVPPFALHQAIDLLEAVNEAEKTRGDRTEKKRVTELLSSSSPLTVPSKPLAVLDCTASGTHTGNVLALASVPGYSSLLLTASASRDLVLTHWPTGTVVARTHIPLDAVVLCADARVRVCSEGKETLEVLVGLMNGAVVLLDCPDIAPYKNSTLDTISSPEDSSTAAVSTPASTRFLSEVWHAKVHQKYVMGLNWTSQGFISGSHDNSLVFFRDVRAMNSKIDVPQDSGVAVRMGEGFEFVRRVSVGGQVECATVLTLTPSSSFSSSSASAAETDVNVDVEGPSEAIAVGVRGDHRLLLFTPTGREAGAVNLNEYGDDYVSFTALSLAQGAHGLLLVGTDKHRVLLVDPVAGKVLRNYYGCYNDGFSAPRVQWVRGGKGVLASSQDNKLHVFDAQTQRCLGQWQAHDKSIKGLAVVQHEGRDVVVSTGFDRKIKLWA